jgi:hypothetical protein
MRHTNRFASAALIAATSFLSFAIPASGQISWLQPTIINGSGNISVNEGSQNDEASWTISSSNPYGEGYVNVLNTSAGGYNEVPLGETLAGSVSSGSGAHGYSLGSVSDSSVNAHHVAQFTVASMVSYTLVAEVSSTSYVSPPQGGAPAPQASGTSTATATVGFDVHHFSSASSTTLATSNGPEYWWTHADYKNSTVSGVLYPGRIYTISGGTQTTSGLNVVSSTGIGSVFSDTYANWNLVPDETTPANLSIYSPSTNGSWHSNGTWSGPVPNAQCAFAFFPEAASVKTVAVNSTTTLGRLGIDSNAAYTFSGSGSFNFNCARGNIDVIKGDHTIAVPITFSVDTDIAVDPTASLRVTSGLSVPAAKKVRIHNRGSLIVNNLSVAATGTLDVDEEAIVVDYTGSSPLASIRSLLINGRNSGAWNGSGISSSAAAAEPWRLALGYGEASALSLTTWRGEAIDSTAVVVDLTIVGDANLDGTVNLTDLITLTANYNATSGMQWIQGDFNYDGAVNAVDLFLQTSNYGKSIVAQGGLHSADMFARDWALAQSMLIPEPITMTSLLLVGATTLTRRRAQNV